MNVFLEDCETLLAGSIYPEISRLIQDGSSPLLFRDQEIYSLVYFGVQPLPSCVGSVEYPEKFYPQKLNLGLFIRMALICSPKSEISQGLTGVLSVLVCFLPRLDL